MNLVIQVRTNLHIAESSLRGCSLRMISQCLPELVYVVCENCDFLTEYNHHLSGKKGSLCTVLFMIVHIIESVHEHVYKR
jgi:hypothetical protein